MTGLEAAQRFKIEINKLDRSSLIDLRIEKVLHYLNKAALFLVKKKFRGPNPGPGRLEIMHPVLDDLKSLIKEEQDQYDETDAEEVFIDLESIAGIDGNNLLYFIALRLKTTCEDSEKWVEGRYIKPERVYKELLSPFNKTRFDDPVYTITDNKVQIFVDNFDVVEYKIKCLLAPASINQNSTITLPFIDEIIDTAVTMALENFESIRLNTQPKISTAIISE